MTVKPFAAAAVLMLSAATAAAGPLPREQVPDPLKSWIPWVLDGHEAMRCPSLPGEDAAVRECVWPARLEIKTSGKGAVFEYPVSVYARSPVRLPGDRDHWPLDVKVNGAQGAVVDNGDTPVIWLPPGAYVISGRFAWERAPEKLFAPLSVGLLALEINGRPAPFPHRDPEGFLWLSREETPVAVENTLEIDVFRHVLDDNPLQVTTRIELRAAGEAREILLAPPVDKSHVPVSLNSPVPARIETDGRLRLQVRPGTWTITLVTRYGAETRSISFPPGQGDWAPEEIWAFQTVPENRVVNITSPAPVDANQTRLPAEWRGFPAYRLAPGEKMTLDVLRRGNSDPAPNQFNLTRELWLDFEGGGFTARDAISGSMHTEWRLSGAPGLLLGRANVNGADQVITRDQKGRMGVEIRHPSFNVQAESRIEGETSAIPSTGWDHDFQRVSATLHLPPGWSALHISGADDVPRTWMRSWTLLDLFLVLVAALAMTRLWGKARGALALAVLVLTFQEPGAPQWIWIALIITEALARYLPAGGLRVAGNLARAGCWLVLLALALPFVVRQGRQAMYPALGSSSGYGDGWSFHVPLGGMAAMQDKAAAPMEEENFQQNAAPAAPPPSPAQDAVQGMIDGKDAGINSFRSDLSDMGGRGKAAPQRSSNLYKGVQRKNRMYQNDPNANVQTGPGLPAWSWQSIAIQWNGPVEKTEQLRLWLAPPWLNSLLSWARLALLLGLLIALARSLTRKTGPSAPAPAPAVSAAAAAMLIVFTFSAGGARAQMPDSATLDQLRERLLRPEACSPNCASIESMELNAQADSLRLNLRVHMAAGAAIALPGGAGHWTPDSVTINGEHNPAMMRDGRGHLLLWLPQGSHAVVMEGRLPGKDAVQLPLPLPPARVTAQAQGWLVAGIRENGRPDGELQLQRVREKKMDSAAPMESSDVPPFVRVTREISLDLQWQVETTVERLNDSSVSAVLAVPLLPGESVTTADLQIQDRKVRVNLTPQQSSVTWTSVLERKEVMELIAPRDVGWSEVWRVSAGPVWHVGAEGIPEAINNQGGEYVWQPWPGEKVKLAITRPEGVPGQTLTILKSHQNVTPGDRVTEVVLTLSMRASLGGQHIIALPEGARALSMSVSGKVLPVHQDGVKLTIPVSPGQQEVVAKLEVPNAISFRYETPRISLETPSVNGSIGFATPRNRWPLWLSGPRLGPAILYWSFLLVLAIISLLLGRIPWIPMRARHWFLLGVGLSQSASAGALVLAGWFLVLGAKRKFAARIPDGAYPLVQILIGCLTFAAAGVLLFAIKEGLLGFPDMHIQGNGSYDTHLNWYQDRMASALPSAVLISAPLWLYRALMLLWALWLARSVIDWARWGFQGFVDGGLVIRPPAAPRSPPPPPAVPPPPVPE
ncbi:MAG: hypothetical protein GMKNLPBB_01064 [Myxococcota bacterium]|nr:hypothetical protein [Myxococcota bacterium]